jgi:hypothetical protein
MRKLLILAVLVAGAIGATGCSSNPCNEGWRPGQMLFGNRRNANSECCEQGMMGPVLQEPCCQ